MNDINILPLTGTEKTILEFKKSKLGKIFEITAEEIPIINSVYNGIVGSIERKNLLITVNEMIDRKIDGKINFNNKEEIEFLSHVILKSIRCSKENQVKRIVDILQGKYDGTIKSFDDAEDLINIISELSENEAKVLKDIGDIHKKRGENSLVYIKDINSYEGNENIDKIFFLCERLSGKGLLQINTVAGFIDSKQTQKENMINKSYLITEVGLLLFSMEL